MRWEWSTSDMSNDNHVRLPVQPLEVWHPTAVRRWSTGGECTLPFPRRAVAVLAGPSPAPGPDAASSLLPAPAASAAHVLSDGGYSQTPRAWHQDQCPASTICQSGSCPGKRSTDQFRVVRRSHAVLQWECEQHWSKEECPCCERGCCTRHTLSLSDCSLTTTLALMSRGRSCMNNRCTSLFPLLPPYTSRRHVSSLDTLSKGSDHYPSNYLEVWIHQFQAKQVGRTLSNSVFG